MSASSSSSNSSISRFNSSSSLMRYVPSPRDSTGGLYVPLRTYLRCATLLPQSGSSRLCFLPAVPTGSPVVFTTSHLQTKPHTVPQPQRCRPIFQPRHRCPQAATSCARVSQFHLNHCRLTLRL